MKFEDYRAHDATGLAALVSSGEVSAKELLETAQARATEVNPKLNAIVIGMNDVGAARACDTLSGPFAGVPFLVKDIVQDYAGVPATSGSRALANNVPETHAEIVNRMLAAGLVIFGKTNTPELALKGVTEPLAYGPTRNPWNPDHTPGGSSGGAGAAVASGIVPMAGASDGGGSIRIPAGYCGLFGLRPSRGRVPAGPRHAEFWEGASSEHVLSRSVRDSAAMLDSLAGPDIGAPFKISRPHKSFATLAAETPTKLRIAYTTRSPIDTPVDPEAVQAVESTVALLRELGHEVENAEPKIDGGELARCYVTMYMGQVAAAMTHAREHCGARDHEFELETRALGMLGRALSAGDYVHAHLKWNRFGRAMGALFEDYDLYLTPTAAQKPARIGEESLPPSQQFALKIILALRAGGLLLKTGIVDQMARDSLQRVPFTQLSNLSYTPSMSVPLHWTTDGLPMGSHFIAPVGEEGRLLALAQQLEHARPWFKHLPAD